MQSFLSRLSLVKCPGVLYFRNFSSKTIAGIGKMVDSKTTNNLDTARTTPGNGLSYGTVLLAAMLLYPQPPLQRRSDL